MLDYKFSKKNVTHNITSHFATLFDKLLNKMFVHMNKNVNFALINYKT